MSHRFDYAKFYYWRIQFIEPFDPDDDRYIVLHGDEGEIVGPMTMALATTWIQHFTRPVLRQLSSAPTLPHRHSS